MTQEWRFSYGGSPYRSVLACVVSVAASDLCMGFILKLQLFFFFVLMLSPVFIKSNLFMKLRYLELLSAKGKTISTFQILNM